MTKYNPMSKEFQDEYKRLGLTGRQLTEKYQREGKTLEKGVYKKLANKYTNEELLNFPRQFYGKSNMDEYNNNITGCHKRCPCTTWINCPGYVDIEEQRRRLRNKHADHYKNIHSWYDIHFRIRYEHGESVGNG